MGDAAGGEGVGQGAHQRFLPDQAGEIGRAVFARQDAVGLAALGRLEAEGGFLIAHGRHHSKRCGVRAKRRSCFGGEYLLNFQTEDPGDGEGERQAWVVAFRLDGIDRLARHVELAGEIGLGHAALAAEPAQRILHPTCHSPIAVAMPQLTASVGQSQVIESLGRPASVSSA